MDQTKVSFAVLMVLHMLVVQQVSAFEIRYKVCSTEELRKSVEQTCMRLAARDSNSDLVIGPYGSIEDGAAGVDSIKLSDAALLEILKLSRPFHRGRKLVIQQPQQSQQAHHWPLYKRSADNLDSELGDYLESCCNRSCLIDPKHLNLYCATRK